MKNILKYEIWIVVIIFIILLILSLAKVISIAWFIGIVIISIVLALLLWALVIYKKKTSENDVEKQKEVKLISSDDAEELIKKELLDLNVLEYIGEDMYKNVRNEGSDIKDAIYSRKFRGYFDKQIISILVNLKTKQVDRKSYDDSKMSNEDIDKDIDKRANSLATSPEKPAKITRQKILDPLTGKYIFGEEITTPKKKEKKDETKKGGLN